MQSLRILTLLLIICVVMCTSTTIDGRKDMRHARRLVGNKFDPKDGHEPQEPLVTRSRLPIPDFPRPKPGGKRISSSSSSEEDASTTQQPGRRLLASDFPITNNGGDGVGNGHNGRHPRSVPVPVTTKASTRGPVQPTTSTSESSTTTTTTTSTPSSSSGLRRLLPGGGNAGGANGGENGRHGFPPRPPRPSDGRSLPGPRPENPRPPHSPRDSSSEDSNEVSTTEASTTQILDDEFERNVINDESQVLEHP